MGGQRHADSSLALAAHVEVRRVDHAEAGAGGGPDELDVAGRVAEAVRAQAHPWNLDTA